MQRLESFDKEFRAGLGYHQPSSPLASVGIMAAATGATSSKYGARRETPKFIAENCTQCMACITACPDTALPNAALDLETILGTAVTNYVSDPKQQELITASLSKIDSGVREVMAAHAKKDDAPAVATLVAEQLAEIPGISEQGRGEMTAILDKLPLAYAKVNAIFSNVEKKAAGEGGIFSIFVSDLCKGCGECVTECGDHNALVMRPDGEDLNADIVSAERFLDLLPDTPQKFLGNYKSDAPEDSKAATLRNHLMERRNYDALVSGDGACAGCGEKSVLHGLASVTEAYMRPIYHRKAERLLDKAAQLEDKGQSMLEALRTSDPKAHEIFQRSVAHIIMGLGGDSDADTQSRIQGREAIDDKELIDALVAVMRQDAFNHKELQAQDGRLANGMSVMAMGAHTGCNTVYGSTPPNNPHPYPWMNSLFQDGVTISWLFAESFIQDNARRSVLPERLADHLLANEKLGEETYFEYTHFTDTNMTDQEVRELPKVWAIGGDGGMGDIGFQNLSKVVLQNRPNVMALMLDTQVYSNTGGQNSDSSPLTGGFDMNQMGAATQGKLVEMKNVAECFLGGHGSPYVSQLAMGDAAKLYKSMLEGLEYRGTAFFHCFTTCQPEHGVADNMANVQAQRVRDSRGLPDFVFNPELGERYEECLSLLGNKHSDRDWVQATIKSAKQKYSYTSAHWAATEARFRNHVIRIKPEAIEGMLHLEAMLPRITQSDVVNRRYLDPEHRSYVPDFEVYIEVEEEDGSMGYRKLSRQMTLFCVERRKAWRLLQSQAGVSNKDYLAQRSLLGKVDKGEIPLAEFLANTRELMDAELAELKKKK